MSGDRGRTGRHGQGDHEMFDELAVGWALHALEPEDETAFARHLLDCRRCERTVAETMEVLGVLAAEQPAADPPERLRHRLRAAVERTEQVRRPAAAQPERGNAEAEHPGPSATRRLATGFPRYRPPPGSRRHSGERLVDRLSDRLPWGRNWLTAVLAAGMAALLGLGAWNVFLTASREQAQTTATQESKIMHAVLRPGRATIAPVSDPAGRSVATVVARRGQVQVIIHGLSMNNVRASTYVVWGVHDGAATALGTFDVVRPDMDLQTAGSAQAGMDSYPIYEISLESGRKAPPAPTEIVASGQVTS